MSAAIDTPCVDTVVEAVREDLKRRSELGIKKYGVTLGNSGLSHRAFLQHAYEEALDLANYLQGAIQVLDREEAERIAGFDPEAMATRAVTHVCDTPEWGMRNPLIAVFTVALRRAFKMGRNA
jgi:hypothetical protein